MDGWSTGASKRSVIVSTKASMAGVSTRVIGAPPNPHWSYGADTSLKCSGEFDRSVRCRARDLKVEMQRFVTLVHQLPRSNLVVPKRAFGECRMGMAKQQPPGSKVSRSPDDSPPWRGCRCRYSIRRWRSCFICSAAEVDPAGLGGARHPMTIPGDPTIDRTRKPADRWSQYQVPGKRPDPPGSNQRFPDA